MDRRLFFLSLLLGAATFNLFYLFLAGLLMAGGLRVLWATARDPEMLRFYSALSKRETIRPRKARSWWTGGDAVVSRAHPPRLPRRRKRHNLLALWGSSTRQRSLGRRPVTLASFIAVAASTTKACRIRNAGRSRIALRRRFDCSMSTAASTVPAQTHGQPVRRRAMRRAGRKRGDSASSDLPEWPATGPA